VAEHVIRLPDVGEGIAEAELVEWHVKVGDLVRADTTLAAVMTDKATVEIPSPVDGEIIWLGAEIGDKVPVGSDLVRLKVPGERDAASTAQPQLRSVAAEEAKPASAAKPSAADSKHRGIVTLTFVRQSEVRDNFAAHITVRFGCTCPAARH
jgi:2-oxoisovalerate dehydrogenase E2 component (dihydrolipoyl transacylase)